ncbi:class I SAM-dependent methyltransferase [Sphingosinicella sp.]|uniref:class I SAM-dependent methyltransferase n=1 Tax=Sphingosinicella sp. TaxID=1917971 RepID=UPI0035B11B08
MEALSKVQDVGDQARADLADLIDLQMSPLGLAAMEALAPASGQTVLDIGCGAGETILQLAERVGTEGRVVGVDIAPRVLEVARTRTTHLTQVTLLQEDAATLRLPSRSIDSAFSRFGTMFFAEPTEAFANIHRMLKLNGRIGFICWRSMQENELDVLPVEAAGLPVRIDKTPFSFEDADTIDHVLRTVGFTRIDIKAHDALISSGNTDAMLKVITRVGALGKVLREMPELMPEAEPRVRAALSAREKDGKVSLGAATWIVSATAT